MAVFLWMNGFFRQPENFTTWISLLPLGISDFIKKKKVNLKINLQDHIHFPNLFLNLNLLLIKTTTVAMILHGIILWPVNALCKAPWFLLLEFFRLSNAKMKEVVHDVDSSALSAKGRILQPMNFLLARKRILCLPTIWNPLSAPALK